MLSPLFFREGAGAVPSFFSSERNIAVVTSDHPCALYPVGLI